MLTVETPCAACTVGTLAFCRCRNEVDLGLMCVDCQAFYRTPERTAATDAHFVPHPALFAGEDPRWAEQNEVEIRSWLADVASERIELT